ncbi:MAG: alpha-glucosidase/alpha-galactosidase [Verrucomicrobiota bacterium]
MAKITFMGAGSSVFAKNVLGDSMLSDALCDAEIALYDIDAERLGESKQMLDALNRNINQGRAKIDTYCGVDRRRDALQDADYAINAAQVGGYEPSTVIDFEVPKKYGLRQVIGDTLGVAGIFRALRTAPVLKDFTDDMEAVCPDVWFLNYANPMVMNTTAVLRFSNVQTVGLCHSVQVCASYLLEELKMTDEVKDLRWEVAGINHQAWLLKVMDGNKDLYPEIKRRAEKMNVEGRTDPEKRHGDMVRFEIMKRFGYYNTESSEHTAEYTPWFIKNAHPELLEEFNIPLDEYPRRCIKNAADWKERSKGLIDNPDLAHEARSEEYASRMMEAMETGNAFCAHVNVMNNGLITNLPQNVAVEVPCLVDRNGVHGIHVGALPEQCAALNRTNVNVQLLAVEAILTGKKDYVYQAAMLDPHTSAELTIDQICSLCDDMIEAHGDMLPGFK